MLFWESPEMMLLLQIGFWVLICNFFLPIFGIDELLLLYAPRSLGSRNENKAVWRTPYENGKEHQSCFHIKENSLVSVIVPFFAVTLPRTLLRKLYQFFENYSEKYLFSLLFFILCSFLFWETLCSLKGMFHWIICSVSPALNSNENFPLDVNFFTPKR